MVNQRLAVGTLLLLAAAASPALAAPAAQAPVDRIDAILQAQVEHDTNITGVSEDAAKVRGLTPEDTTYTPTLTVNLNFPVSRQTFFFKGLASYLFHDQNKVLDSEHLDLDAGVQSRVGKCNVVTDGRYQRSLSQLSDIVALSTVTNMLEVEHVGISTTCGRQTGLGGILNVSRDWGNNDKVAQQVQDYVQTAVTGGATYGRPHFGDITVFGTFQRTEFPHRERVSGEVQGYDLKAGGVTFERHLGARIDGTVTASYTTVDSLTPPTPTTTSLNFKGMTYQANLSFRATHRLRTEATFERAVTPSNRVGNSVDVGTHYRVKGTYDLGSRISVDLGAEEQDIDSKGSQVFVGNLTNSTLKTIFGGVSYKPSKRLSLDLDARQEQRRANSALYNYDNTRVDLTASVRY